jgi:hypothetical protein
MNYYNGEEDILLTYTNSRRSDFLNKNYGLKNNDSIIFNMELQNLYNKNGININ